MDWLDLLKPEETEKEEVEKPETMDTTITIRISREEKKLLKKVARYSKPKTTLTGLLKNSALEKAQEWMKSKT